MDICRYSVPDEEICKLLFEEFKQARMVYVDDIIDESRLKPVTKDTFEVKYNILSYEFFDKNTDDVDSAIVDVVNHTVALFGSDTRREALRNRLNVAANYASIPD